MARRVGFGGELPPDAPDAPPIAPLWTRLPAILFLIAWLMGWSAGIVLAVLSIVNGTTADAFLLFWVAGASLGWVLAVRALIGLLRGKSMSQMSVLKK